MSTYQRDLLTARFAALAPRTLSGDWDDVLDRAGSFRPRRRRLARSLWGGGRRRKLVVALAVAVLVAGVAAGAYGTMRVLILDKGFVGLPPLGATPSSPERGELVVSFRARSMDGRLTEVFVYADGRVIRLREGGAPGGANELTSGFLERRLTPEGVELLRSNVASSGLFARDLELISRHGYAGTIRARIGPGLVTVSWIRPEHAAVHHYRTNATPEQEHALERLDALLTHPAASLPARAWQQLTVRAYVPSRYAACFVGEPSRVVPLLPEPAGELFVGRDLEKSPYGGHPVHYCSDVTTDEARVAAEALDEAEFQRVESRYRLAYTLELPGSEREHVGLWFEPRLPDGEFTCTACG